MNTNISYDQVRHAVEAHGFVFFDAGPYDLNLVAIRNDNRDFRTDAFDDLVVCAYLDHNNQQQIEVWPATTDPGLCMITHPVFAEAIARGACFVAPGQYRGVFAPGQHGSGAFKHDALVQVRQMQYYRVKSATGDVPDLDDNPKIWGLFGTNLHHSYSDAQLKYAEQMNAPLRIGNFSAGCQVLLHPEHLTRLLALAALQAQYGHGSALTYSLILQRYFYIS